MAWLLQPGSAPYVLSTPQGDPMQQPEEDVRAFVGPNADYYLQAWAAVDPNVGLQALRWNWPAFFLNVFWLLYRRMYKYFWITFAAFLGIGLLEGMVETIWTSPRDLAGSTS